MVDNPVVPSFADTNPDKLSQLGRTELAADGAGDAIAGSDGYREPDPRLTAGPLENRAYAPQPPPLQYIFYVGSEGWSLVALRRLGRNFALAINDTQHRKDRILLQFIGKKLPHLLGRGADGLHAQGTPYPPILSQEGVRGDGNRLGSLQ